MNRFNNNLNIPFTHIHDHLTYFDMNNTNINFLNINLPRKKLIYKNLSLKIINKNNCRN